MNEVFVFGVSLVAAVAIVYGFARHFRRGADLHDFEWSPDSASDRLIVVSRARFGIGRSLIVVRIGDRRLLLGLTRGQWTTLADLGTSDSSGDLDDYVAELSRAMGAHRFHRGGSAS
jgi:flagellar biogenesis protein FliO